MKKITDAEKRIMLDMLDEGKTLIEVANKFGCCTTTIINLKNRGIIKASVRSYSGGGPNYEEMKGVKEMKEAGFKVSEIATYFEVSVPTIYNWLAKAKRAF